MQFDFEIQMGPIKYHYLSDSFIRNISSLYNQVNKFIKYYQLIIDNSTLNTIYKINNIYPYLHDVLTTETSSYINNGTSTGEQQLFFVFVELYNTFDFINLQVIENFNKVTYVGDNPEIFVNCIQYIKQRPPGISGPPSYTLNEIMASISFKDKNVATDTQGLTFFDITNIYNNETRLNNYVIYLLKTLFVSIHFARPCVIKIWNITYKPILEIIYMFSNIYNTVYISKPIVTQHQHDRYLVCNELNIMYTSVESRQKLSTSILSLINSFDNNNYTSATSNTSGYLPTTSISSILKNKISYHFLNKVEESTLIIGQKNIEYYENLIMLLKMYGKQDKIEHAKKNSLLKCIHWCIKNNLNNTHHSFANTKFKSIHTHGN